MAKYGKHGKRRYPRQWKQAQNLNVSPKIREPERSLLADWREVKLRERYVESEFEAMTFNYGQALEYKEDLARGLAAWRFLRESVRYNWRYDSNLEREQTALRENMCLYGNRFERLIGCIELLPLSVWRKILWAGNIDFVSFESFLRRLSKAQAEMISENYQDFKAGRIPRIFSELDIRRHKITIKSLRAEPYNRHQRYDTKSAMSYNLLNLDFGFNAYPKGAQDDTKIIEVSPLRFLSKKDHANDFVVNKEGGRYFRLYKSARSNYVYHPSRRIDVKKAMCPGFWWTLIVHFWFWIASPAAVIGLVKLANDFRIDPVVHSTWPTAVLIILFVLSVLMASLTPLWCFAALLKKLFSSFDEVEITLPSWLAKIGQSKLFDKDVWETIAIVAVCTVVIGAIGFGEYSTYVGLRTVFNIPETLTIMLPLQLFLGYLVVTRFQFRTWPWYVTMPLTYAGLLILASIVKRYQLPIIKALMVTYHYVCYFWLSMLEFIWQLVTVMGVVWLLVLIPFGFCLWLIVAMGTLSIEMQTRIDYWIEKASRAFVVVTILVFLAGLVWCVGAGQLTLQNVGSLILFLLVTVGVSVWLAYFSQKVNPEISAMKAELIQNRVPRYRGENDYLLVLKNQEFNRLSQNERYLALRQLSDWCWEVMPCGDDRTAYAFLLSRISLTILTKLEDCLVDLQSLPLEWRLTTLKLMVEKNLGVAEAYEAGKQAEQQQKKQAEDRAVWLKKFAWPVTKGYQAVCAIGSLIGAICCGLWWLLKKCWEIISTLYRLYELFHQRCPYVAQSKVLD